MLSKRQFLRYAMRFKPFDDRYSHLEVHRINEVRLQLVVTPKDDVNQAHTLEAETLEGLYDQYRNDPF